MNKQMRKEIIKIARKTRAFIVNNKYKIPYYNGIPPHLGGLCGHASVILSHNLRQAGMPAQIVTGMGHWFVKCEDFLVDITASQFGQGQVCVRNFNKAVEMAKGNNYNMTWWSPTRISDDPQHANLISVLHQLRKSWNMPELWASIK